MDLKFRSLIASLEPRLERLRSMPAVKFSSLPKSMPGRGVYLLSESTRHLYVGRTNRLRQRLQNHCRPSGNHYTATFAFLIARHRTGHRRATYARMGSRSSLLRNPKFRRAFERAKQRVARMDIRYVGEAHPVRQALLEIYAATVLGTKYNDFDTH